MPVDITKLPKVKERLEANRRCEDATKKVHYVIVAAVGSGAFGAVYKAECVEDKTEWAIKCEPVECKKKMLQQEFKVMRLGRSSGSPYFAEYGERGIVPDRYRFITMQLVDKNLWDLLTERGGFSLLTSCRISLQTLAALRDLHEVNFLHRDVKPPNFAVGRKEGDKDSIIYMLDFGMARQFRSSEGKLIPRRATVQYRGTMRYASCDTLDYKEQSRKDDIESWFYMMIEFATGSVPWNKMKDKKEVLARKKQFLTDKDDFKSYLGNNDALPEFVHILKYLNEAEYYTIPHYEGLKNVILKMIEKVEKRPGEALDWSPRRAYSPPDWDMAKYVKAKDRFKSDPAKTEKLNDSDNSRYEGKEPNNTTEADPIQAIKEDNENKEKEKKNGEEKEKEMKESEKKEKEKKDKKKEEMKEKERKDKYKDDDDKGMRKKKEKREPSMHIDVKPSLKRGTPASSNTVSPLPLVRQKESKKGSQETPKINQTSKKK